MRVHGTPKHPTNQYIQQKILLKLIYEPKLTAIIKNTWTHYKANSDYLQHGVINLNKLNPAR